MNRFILAACALIACVALPLTSCRTVAAESTPAEIRSAPTSQSVALEVAIEKITNGDPAWVDENGNVLREPILAILRADKDAWDQLDRFYNGGE